MLDPFSYTSPSRVRTLLIPINDLEETQFLDYVDQLKRTIEVRLVDVTPISNPSFNPQGFPSGRVIYDYQLNNNNAESLFLHDFEPFRKDFVVIGLVKYSPELAKDVLFKKMDHFRKLYPNSMVHSFLVFDSPTETSYCRGQSPIFHICNDITNLETIMCDITKVFLEELAVYASSYQNITLRSPGSMIDNNITRTITKTQKRLSSNPSLAALDPKNERRQQRVKGRQSKVLGNFYLLAGRYPDALKEFSEAASLLRPSGDYLWLGSALEGIGICIVLLSFLGVPYQMPAVLNSIINNNSSNGANLAASFASPTNSPRNSVSSKSSIPIEINSMPIPDLINQLTIKILMYYGLSVNDYEDFVPDLVYCETILRFVKFMTVVHLGGGFNPPVLETIVRNKKLSRKKINEAYFNKSDILKYSNKLFTLQLRKMNVISQCRVYCTLASIYGDLSLLRKKAFILRILFVTIIPSLTNGEDKKTYDLSLANGDEPQNDNIQELLESLLLIYGISSEPESNAQDAANCPWYELHKSIIKLCIKLCYSIDSHQNVIQFQSLLLTRYLHCLSSEEQSELFNSIMELNGKGEINYWDPFLIRDIKLLKINNHLFPSKEPINGANDSNEPLIYNPFDKSNNKSNNLPISVLVQDEIIEVSLKFQNPFSFQIDISNWQIVTDGKVKVETLSSSDLIIIQPFSNIELVVPIKPLNVGELNIIGCNLKVCGLNSSFYHVCDDEKYESFRKLKKKGVEANIDNFAKSLPKDTDIGVLESSFNNLKLNKVEQRTTTKQLLSHVISPQPILSLVDLSLNNGWIMLLEGEKLQFSIRLQNLSQVLINYLSFAFWDSTVEPLTNVLSSRDLPPNEVYEIEYFLIKEKPLKILNKQELKLIKEYESITINFEIFGKKSMKESKIILEYCSKTPDSSIGDQFFLRRLTIPINITVNPSIELVGCEILPLMLSKKQLKEAKDGFNEHILNYLNNIPETEQITDYCLLILDFKNVWQQKIDIILENVKEGPFMLEDSLSPGNSQRYVIPIKRINFTQEELARPIPSLRNKQFVVNNKMSVEESNFIKSSFWFREELLSKISCKWKDSNRQGEIDIRSIRLSQKMCDSLRFEKILCELSIVHNHEEDDTLQKNGMKFSVQIENFYKVRTRITNNSNKSIKGIIRHIPISSHSASIDRKLLFNGILQQHLKQAIQPGEFFEYDLSMVVLDKGDYEWGCIFEFDANQVVPREPIYISAY